MLLSLQFVQRDWRGGPCPSCLALVLIVYKMYQE
jgi:hypothetical protein